MGGSTYTVKTLKGCKVVTGTIPVQDLAALLGAWGADWLIDGQLAHAQSVALVVGPATDIQAWREELGLDKNK
ncbi:MAG: hypothetical protein LPH21_07420 [Shewanella sp.]|nr:hypothetical protein [Shewanella sp.]